MSQEEIEDLGVKPKLLVLQGAISYITKSMYTRTHSFKSLYGHYPSSTLFLKSVVAGPSPVSLFMQEETQSERSELSVNLDYY